MNKKSEQNKGHLIWITGLPGSGKSTLAKQLVHELKAKEIAPILIDGDQIRELFQNDLGYTIEDRIKNAYRIARICHFLAQQGFIVICATCSLFHEIHKYNRQNNANYTEVYLEIDSSTLQRRNQKGMYDNDTAVHVYGKDQQAQLPQEPTFTFKSQTEDDLSKNVLFLLDLIAKS